MISFVDFQAQRQALNNSIERTILQTVESDQYILGPSVELLENELCSFTTSKFCITCANGTDALVAALMALGINSEHHEVITPAFSYIAPTEAIITVGAKPVFVDVESDTQNIDVEKVESVITANTKAIIAVSLFGQTCELNLLREICDKNEIFLIEDGAQSFGSTHYQKKSCTIADVSTTSFFPTKPLGCYGDGGAIFTNDPELNVKLRMIVRHGQKKKYVHETLGMNSRLDSLQASILLEKLKILNNEIVSRNLLHSKFNNFLSSCSELTLPKIRKYNMSSVAQYTLRTQKRDDLIDRLTEAKIPYAIHYPIPIYKQEYIQDKIAQMELPVTENLCRTVISLPLNAYMSTEDVENICEVIMS